MNSPKGCNSKRKYSIDLMILANERLLLSPTILFGAVRKKSPISDPE